MKILSLDSTAIVSTVAICENERLLAQFTINNGNTHSETLLPMIEASLKVLKLTVDDIDLFACSAGPGSFTGVRIGASTVKGLAFNKNKPCAPVSSLDALAHNLLYADGIVCPVMNARRGQQGSLGLGAGMRLIRGQSADLAIQHCNGGVYRLLLLVANDVHRHVGNGNGKFLSHNVLLSLAKGGFWVYNRSNTPVLGNFTAIIISL